MIYNIIEMLNRVVCHTTSEYEQKQKVVKEAKVLVERNEAKKPIYDAFDIAMCPRCEHWVINEAFTFCPTCGQKLDWEGNE